MAMIEIKGAVTSYYETESVPRVGDHIWWNDAEYHVDKVVWVPNTPTVKITVSDPNQPIVRRRPC